MTKELKNYTITNCVHVDDETIYDVFATGYDAIVYGCIDNHKVKVRLTFCNGDDYPFLIECKYINGRLVFEGDIDYRNIFERDNTMTLPVRAFGKPFSDANIITLIFD